MSNLSIADLWSLEEYAKRRPQFRAEAIARKKARTVHLGPHMTLLFEDALTIRYQIQEMLRIERTFEEEGIQAELDAYNPLIPDGSNLKATLLIEYPDEAARRKALSNLVGVEHAFWIECGGEKVAAIADEDLDRSNESKTSAVHFLRFPIGSEMAARVKAGKQLTLGVSHPNYSECVALNASQAKELGRDLV